MGGGGERPKYIFSRLFTPTNINIALFCLISFFAARCLICPQNEINGLLENAQAVENQGVFNIVRESTHVAIEEELVTNKECL